MNTYTLISLLAIGTSLTFATACGMETAPPPDDFCDDGLDSCPADVAPCFADQYVIGRCCYMAPDGRRANAYLCADPVKQCNDPNKPNAPCVTESGCDGTCYPPATTDAGTVPGMCQPKAGGACGACFVNSDCAGLFAQCHVAECDPTGKQTAPGAPMHGCHLRPVSGGACVTDGGSALGVCKLEGADSVCAPAM